VFDAAVTASGQVYVAGSFTNFNGNAGYVRIARLNSNGALDTTFTPGTGFNNTVFSLSLESDGSILAGGAFTTFNNNSSAFTFAHVNANGSLDTSFAAYPNGTVRKLLRQPDGKNLIAGLFTSIGGV